MKSAVEGDKALSASLQCRLSDCEGLVQLLRSIESECRSKAEREGAEQAGRLNDMATLEKKSVQYKEVSAALLLGYADIAQQCACHGVPTRQMLVFAICATAGKPGRAFEKMSV